MRSTSIILALCFMLSGLFAGPAFAGDAVTAPVVNACGQMSYIPGVGNQAVPQTTTGLLCVGGTGASGTVTANQGTAGASPWLFNLGQWGGVNLTTGNPLPVSLYGAGGGTVVTSPLVVTPTDRGGTITTGGTAQSLMASNSSRKDCLVQNPIAASEDIFVSSTSTTPSTTGGTPDDADLGPGMSWSCSHNGTVIQTAIYIIATTTAHAFIAKEMQ